MLAYSTVSYRQVHLRPEGFRTNSTLLHSRIVSLKPRDVLIRPASFRSNPPLTRTRPAVQTVPGRGFCRSDRTVPRGGVRRTVDTTGLLSPRRRVRQDDRVTRRKAYNPLQLKSDDRPTTWRIRYWLGPDGGRTKRRSCRVYCVSVFCS